MGRNDKLLIINGSPRKIKNCHSVVKELVKKFILILNLWKISV